MNLTTLISSPSRWSKFADARDKDGRPVNISKVWHDSQPKLKNIQSFSLIGAIMMLFPFETKGGEVSRRRYTEMTKLRNAIKNHTGKDVSVAAFNDAPTTDYKDIEAVLKIYATM